MNIVDGVIIVMAFGGFIGLICLAISISEYIDRRKEKDAEYMRNRRRAKFNNEINHTGFCIKLNEGKKDISRQKIKYVGYFTEEDVMNGKK